MSKNDLIDIIRKNMLTHKQNYEKAWEGFVKLAVETLEKNLENVRNKKKVSVYVNETIPKDMTPEYERALGMLSHHNDEYVFLNAEDYSRYVEDNWEWKQNWTSSNSKYTG